MYIKNYIHIFSLKYIVAFYLFTRLNIKSCFFQEIASNIYINSKIVIEYKYLIHRNNNLGCILSQFGPIVRAS